MATKTKLITYDDYQNLPDDGKRYEIIGGKLFMTASPIPKHQRISQNLEFELERYLRQHEVGEMFHAQMDVVLSMTDVVQPDILFISKERSHIITEKNIVEAPDLVVEILSEGTKIIDQTRKKDLYEKYGVKEYWIVYPDEQQIEQYILQNDVFVLKSKLEEAQMLHAVVLRGFHMALENIFNI